MISQDYSPTHTMDLLPASDFSVEELTDAYNRTRTDYLIPMPMNPSRMQEYIDLYDVDLSRSKVAMENDIIVGLGMLGVRSGMSWITRMGVLPEGRRQKTGTALLAGLIEESDLAGLPAVWLEVIKNNVPAHTLFRQFGFKETRELIVARRAPGPARNKAMALDARQIEYLEHDDVIELHRRRQERMNWLIAFETMCNVRRPAPPAEVNLNGSPHEFPHLSGLLVEYQDGAQGWVSFQATALQLKRICVEVICGDPATTTANLLDLMHHLHASQDAIIENIPDDKRWDGYRQAGYFETFRRIEMVRTME